CFLEVIMMTERRMIMKVFWDAFIQSLQLPKRKAVFALNRIGMDVVVVYLFIFLAIASIPGLIVQLTSNQVDTNIEIHTFFLLIFFFIFYYLIILLVVFTGISIIAYLGAFFATQTNRKLQFGLMWKMTAFATTIPLVTFTILSFFIPLSTIFLSVASIFILLILLKIILIYPKRKAR